MLFFSASGQMNWYWKWHFLCVPLHPFLFMYVVPLALLRYLSCQEWIHGAAYPSVTWLVSVRLCWRWIPSILFLSISDGARAYSRRVLSRWSKYINCDQLLPHAALALVGRAGAHTQHTRLCAGQNWSHRAHRVGLRSVCPKPRLFAICIFRAHWRCLAAISVQGTGARRKPYRLISS